MKSTFYNEQIDTLSKLTQEEIVALYESEGIIFETAEEQLIKLNDLIMQKEEELEKLRENRAEQKIMKAIFETDEQKKIASLEVELYNLKKTYEEFKEMRNSMIESMPMLLSNLNNEFDNINEKIELEIKSKNQELKELNENSYDTKEKNITKLKEEIEELKKEALKFKNTYRTFAKKFSNYTRKYIKRDRKYPSNELRNKIVLGTIGIAKYWAKVYFYKTENTIPFDDLFQIASQSLVSAAHYYIPSERATFSTYARRCIENKLKQEVYNKRKSKKMPYNPKDFFKKERDRIKYITLFLNVLRTKSRSGLTLYYSEKYIERTSVILDRFREQIRDHNREMKLRNELDRLLPSFGGKRTKERLDEIVERIIKMLNESKLRALVTDEDRNLASLYVNYQKKPLETQEIYELIYYLDCYRKKIDLIESYLTVEQDFMEKNSSITPSDEEMLALLNKDVKSRNSERYRLRRDGLFNKGHVPYHYFYDYYNAYKDTYDVDPFISGEEYDRGGYKSKEKERDEILSQLEDDCDDLIDILMNMIDEIEASDVLKVVLCFSDNPFQIYEDWKVYEEGNDYIDGDVLDKEKAIERLYDISISLNSIDYLDSEKVEEYLNGELKTRKDRVNAYLLEMNAPVIIQNQEIAELNDKLSKGAKYEKRFTMEQLIGIKRDIELLYEDDSDFFMLMYMDNRKSKRTVDISLEEEVINNLFLKDYYAALDELTEIEKQVLLNYYDVNGIHSKTAKEIGEELCISERKVYNIKTRALKKLSFNSKLKGYNEY